MKSPPVSRRDFLCLAFAASSALAAGLPVEAFAAARDRARTGIRGRGPLVRGLRNVQVSHDGRGRGYSEPSLAVNPRNPRNLLAVSMWGPDAYVSFDGGSTWRKGGTLRLPPGSGGGNVSAAFDGAGRGFVCGGFGAGAGGRSAVLVWRSENGGRTFSSPVAAGQGANLDRPWLAAEHHSPGMAHVVWSEGPRSGLSAGLTTELRYTRSSDGGKTFETSRSIAGEAAGLSNPVVACGPPGFVYILYSSGRGGIGDAPPDSGSTVTVVSSHDRGETFGPPVALGRSTDFLSFPGRGGTGSSLPAIAAHRDSGLVCVAFVDHEAGEGRSGVLLAASRDAGRTRTRAAVPRPHGNVVYFQPEVAIDDAGRIGVMAFAMEQGMVNVVLTISEPRSLRFDPPITVTDRPFDPSTVNDQLGDYQALAATPGAFHPFWNDTRSGQLELFTAVVATGR